jgi:hypothetical protein
VIGRKLFEDFPDLPHTAVENNTKSILTLKIPAFPGREQPLHLFEFHANRPVTGNVGYIGQDCGQREFNDPASRYLWTQWQQRVRHLAVGNNFGQCPDTRERIRPNVEELTTVCGETVIHTMARCLAIKISLKQRTMRYTKSKTPATIACVASTNLLSRASPPTATPLPGAICLMRPVVRHGKKSDLHDDTIYPSTDHLRSGNIKKNQLESIL